MVPISIRTNIAEVKKTLSDVAKTQLPFAIARALTDTAKDVQRLLTAALPRQLDRPTPFTMRAFAVTPATKKTLTSKVYIKPDQWKYLKLQVEGGVRKPSKRALILPKSLKLNQYGNMPRAAVKRLLAYKKRFPFNQIGQRAATKSFDKNFRESIDKALATMR